MVPIAHNLTLLAADPDDAQDLAGLLSQGAPRPPLTIRVPCEVRPPLTIRVPYDRIGQSRRLTDVFLATVQALVDENHISVLLIAQTTTANTDLDRIRGSRSLIDWPGLKAQYIQTRSGNAIYAIDWGNPAGKRRSYKIVRDSSGRPTKLELQ